LLEISLKNTEKSEHHQLILLDSNNSPMLFNLLKLKTMNQYEIYRQARSSLYANTQLRAHRRAEKTIKSKQDMEDRLPEPITLQTRQNSIG
jgi:hypothetical protein